MKLLPHEQKRLQQNAALTLRLSPDTRPEVTKKNLLDFTQDIGNTLRKKRQVKHWILALVETDKEQG